MYKKRTYKKRTYKKRTYKKRTDPYQDLLKCHNHPIPYYTGHYTSTDVRCTVTGIKSCKNDVHSTVHCGIGGFARIYHITILGFQDHIPAPISCSPKKTCNFFALLIQTYCIYLVGASCRVKTLLGII